jgi:hypothetical protein
VVIAKGKATPTASLNHRGLSRVVGVASPQGETRLMGIFFIGNHLTESYCKNIDRTESPKLPTCKKTIGRKAVTKAIISETHHREFMEPVSIATTIAVLFLTKALEKTGEKFGEGIVAKMGAANKIRTHTPK